MFRIQLFIFFVSLFLLRTKQDYTKSNSYNYNKNENLLSQPHNSISNEAPDSNLEYWEQTMRNDLSAVHELLVQLRAKNGSEEDYFFSLIDQAKRKLRYANQSKRAFKLESCTLIADPEKYELYLNQLKEWEASLQFLTQELHILSSTSQPQGKKKNKLTCNTSEIVIKSDGTSPTFSYETESMPTDSDTQFIFPINEIDIVSKSMSPLNMKSPRQNIQVSRSFSMEILEDREETDEREDNRNSHESRGRETTRRDEDVEMRGRRISSSRRKDARDASITSRRSNTSNTSFSSLGSSLSRRLRKSFRIKSSSSKSKSNSSMIEKVSKKNRIPPNQR